MTTIHHVHRSLVFTTLLVWVQAVALLPRAKGARIILQLSGIRQDTSPIVLAEITQSTPKTLPPRRQGRLPRQGHAISLRIHEVLRGTLAARQINIPFSSRGYSGVWEGDVEPEVGLKALVYLSSGQGAEWKDYGRPGTFVALDTFQDPRVATVREIIRFWRMEGTAEQRRALEAGCFDDDMGFRHYCIRMLRQGIRRDDAEEEGKVRAFLWEVFTDPRTSVEHVMQCDNFFRHEYRTLDWRTFEPRYSIIAQAVRRHMSAEGEIHHNIFGSAVDQLRHFPGHRNGALSLHQQIVRASKEIYKFGTTIGIGRLYDIAPDDPDTKRFNAKLLAHLHQYLSSDNGSVADGAACALGEICRRAAQHGLLSEELRGVLERAAKGPYSAQVKGRLGAGLSRAVETAKATKRVDPEGAPPLVHGGWERYDGRRVRLVGSVAWERTEAYGVAVEINSQLVWLEGVKSWPSERRGGTKVLVTGTLGMVADKPVFRCKRGAPFGVGLPVPEPVDLDKLRRRYVLRGATWEFLAQKPAVR